MEVWKNYRGRARVITAAVPAKSKELIQLEVLMTGVSEQQTTGSRPGRRLAVPHDCCCCFGFVSRDQLLYKLRGLPAELARAGPALPGLSWGLDNKLTHSQSASVPRRFMSVSCPRGAGGAGGAAGAGRGLTPLHGQRP